MAQYIQRRLLLAVVVLFGVTLVVSALLHVSGDPVAIMLAGGTATPEQRDQLRRELGFDKPFILQYVDFVLGATQGDLGRSLRMNRPVVEVIFERLPSTSWLTTVAMLLAIAVAVPVGVISAARPNSAVDNLGRLLTLIGQSVP